jgi:hypothetical protein
MKEIMELKIKKETAKKLYDSVPDWFKEELTEAFGKNTFQKRKFTDIKSFEDACEELGLSTAQFYGTETPDEVAYKKIKIIIKAINQGWTPDWSNTSEHKWWLYFSLSSGFGFSDSCYDFVNSDSSVGSRLCFESEDKATYTAKQFIDLYKAFLT